MGHIARQIEWRKLLIMPTLWQPVYMIKGFFGTHKICSMPNKTNNIYTQKKKKKKGPIKEIHVSHLIQSSLLFIFKNHMSLIVN